MEEDLKVLEKELANIRNLIDYYAYEALDLDKQIRMERFKKAIENLIASYKELEEELRPIKNIEKALDEMDIEGMWNDIKAEDYIPKSKLQEIIEDIDNSQPVIAELKLRKLVEGDK